MSRSIRAGTSAFTTTRRSGFFQILHIDGKPRVRIIDYYEASGLGADEILKEAMPEYSRDLQDRVEAMLGSVRRGPFKYQRHFLPHDVKQREWGAGAKTRLQTLNELGVPIGGDPPRRCAGPGRARSTRRGGCCRCASSTSPSGS